MAKAKPKGDTPLVSERCRTLEVHMDKSALSKWIGEALGIDMSEYAIDDDQVIEVGHDGSIGLVFTKRGPAWNR